MTQATDNQSIQQQALQQRAARLQQALQAGDWSTATQLVEEINQVRNRALYDEVAKLTRELHTAFLDLQIDASNPHAREISQITDATERLSYVVKMTEKAANDTIDLVEASAPLVNYISYEAQSLTADWQRFIRREMPLEEFRELAHRIEAFLLRSLRDSDQMSANLNEIMMAQTFQDLTGQVIKRVNELIAYIEESLVRMVGLASTVDMVAGIEHCPESLKKTAPVASTQGEGPQIHTGSADVVADQVDVDDLLSSLGL